MRIPWDKIYSCYHCPFASGDSLHPEYGFCPYLKRIFNYEEVKKYPPPEDCPLPKYDEEVDD